jgi:membrane protein DedA with SNARE-associated domain
MDGVALAGLVGLLFVKEAGIPIPVPGDLLVITAGIASAGLGAAAPAPLIAILLAGYLGGSVQFLVVRGALRERFLRLLARLGVAPDRIEGLAEWLRRRGARGVAVARATPGVRIGAIAASGVADLPYRRAFLPGLVVGNGLFVGGHFALGFVIGPPAIAAAAAAGPGLLAGATLLVLAGLGAVAWRWLRRRDRAPGGEAGKSADLPLLPGIGSWTEAACPACIAISVAARRGST